MTDLSTETQDFPHRYLIARPPIIAFLTACWRRDWPVADPFFRVGLGVFE
jgi:hypothetical protein